MSVVGQVLSTVLWLYLLVLLARVVVDLVLMMSRDWVPRGFVLLIVEGIYTVTDPPLRFLRRFIPPLRVGGVALDLSFLVLFLGINVLLSLVRLI